MSKIKPIQNLRTLYDVEQLLKRFDVYIHVGKRLWDIELVAIEIDHLHDAGVLEDRLYAQAKLVLRREHREEEARMKDNHGINKLIN